jgi:hypothetical protein
MTPVAILTGICAVIGLITSAITAYVTLKISEQVAQVELRIIRLLQQDYVRKDEHNGLPGRMRPHHHVT